MELALAFIGIAVITITAHRLITRRNPELNWYQLRPSGSAPELEHVIQHAVSAVGQVGGNVAVVMTRRPEGVINLIGVPDGTSRAGVNAIARAVNAVLEETDPPPLSAGTAVIGQVPAKFPWSGATSNKGDVAHAAKAIGDALSGFGDWVAVVARPQSSRESTAVRKWYAHIDDGPGVQTHPCCAKGAMIAELWAGGANRDVAASHLSTLTQSLAGFDVSVKAGRANIVSLRLIVAGITGLAALVAAWWGYFEPVALAAAAALVAIPQLVMWRNPNWYGMRRRLASLRDGAPRRVPRLRPFHAGYKKETRNEDGSIKRFERNDYPLGDYRVPFGAQHLAFVAAPHSGAASGAVTVRQGEPATELSKTGGVLIGTADTSRGERDILIPNNIPRTLMTIGVPGAGKLLPLNAPVPVPVTPKNPSGWTTVGQLEIGDKVYGRNGSEITVLALSDVDPRPEMFVIELDDGQEIVACADHRWSVETRRDRLTAISPKRRLANQRWIAEMEMCDKIEAIASTIDPNALFGFGEMQEVLLSVGGGSRDIEPPPSRIGAARWGSYGNLTIIFAEAGIAPTNDSRPYLFEAREALTHLTAHLRKVAGPEPKVEYQEQVMTTREMVAAGVTVEGGRLNFSIRSPQPIDGSELDLPIDPYTLGSWLGDGSSYHGQITTSAADACNDPTGSDSDHFLAEIEQAGYRVKNITAKKNTDNNYSVTIDGFYRLLSREGLIRNKHIPPIYLRASLNQRLALLQGIIDTDGHIQEKGGCEIGLSDERLMTDVVELVRSLGIHTTIRSRVPSYRNAETGAEPKTQYRIHFTTTLPIARLPRKARRLPDTIRASTRRWFIKRITPTTSVPGRCIMVDAPDSMWLCHGFVPTHNSELLRSVFASDCLARTRGEQRAMIVLESQGGKQVGRWTSITSRIGIPTDDVIVIDINDPATPAVNMFAGDGTPHMRAGRFLDLFFGSDDNDDGGVALTPSLQALLAVALEIPDHIADTAGVRTGSPIWYASVLSGSQAGGDDTALELWKAYANFARGREVKAAAAAGVEISVEEALSARVLQRTGIGDAAIRLEPYMRMKEQERRREFQPAQRRLAALASIDHWFSPERERHDWADLIDAGKVVILNHGDPARPGVTAMEPQWADRLSRMLLAGIQTGIRTACQGWDDEGRRLTVTADELAIVAGTDPETPEWLRQQARKYGVDLCFATQAAHQLDDKLLKTVLGFGTVIWLQLGNEPSLLDLARNFLSVEPGVWDGIVDSIPKYHGIVLTTDDGQRIPGALVHLIQAGELDQTELRRRTIGR